MTANPNQHWEGGNPTSVSRFVTRIVGSINVSQIQFVRVSVKCVIVCYWPGAMSLRGQ